MPEKEIIPDQVFRKSFQIKLSVFTLQKLFPQRCVFSVSSSQGNDQLPTQSVSLQNYFSYKDFVLPTYTFSSDILIINEFIHLGLTYLYRKATAEIEKFNSKLVVEKIAYKKDGILLSKRRLFHYRRV